ncbi:hypothetical protein [Amycolatopsis magusensis]|uniref:Uncharacterized protein n=1 Tax=Amycolatopsis magusensis TaxID=882444 RepID=A0ABS4PU49_9PSEU|nr:hypothetical protein [Amycolatopsis magusensis]MBP2182958.1 hypothetical protein [Amycolatopsis magusensis]
MAVPRDPDQHGEEYRFGEMMLAVALGTVSTLCGYVVRRQLGSGYCAMDIATMRTA